VDERTEREKMLAGRLFLPFDPELELARVEARRLAQAYAACDPGADAQRGAILSRLFAHFGRGAFVEAPFHCDYGWNITLGDEVYLNAGCVLLDCAPITIGARSMLGPGVQLCAVTHPLDPDERRSRLETGVPIVLGENVWIGAGVVVGPGVTIGDGSVVGAGSVVLRDVPAGVLVAGNPARVMRSLK
jgi:maltose O-acetyltransferase